MRVPKDDARAGYLPILEQLMPLYLRLWDDPPSVRAGYQRVAHLAHGWYLRCQRGVEALLLLGDAGYADEASPIRRSIIEHVLALRWLAVEGDAIDDTIARSHADDVEKRAKAVEAAEWQSIDLAEIN